MLNGTGDKKQLNQALRVFFGDALRITLRRPGQALYFIRTLRWLFRAAQKRSQLKKQGLTVPPIIIFSITNRCNLQCQGCYAQTLNSEIENELSDIELSRIVQEAEEAGVSFFVIAGGEPFLRRELLHITEMHPQMIFFIFTNGLLIDESAISILKKQKNAIPLMSLEGYRDETDLRRGEGTYQIVRGTMERLKHEGVFFGTSLTLTRNNFDILTSESFTKDFFDVGCRFFLYLEYTPITEGTESWVLTRSQRERMRELMQIYRKKFASLFIAVPWDEDDVGGCLSAGRGFVHINAAGDVEPCPFAPFSDSNVRDVPLIDALQSELFVRIRAVPELSKENGDGCILWKERERVQALLEVKVDV